MLSARLSDPGELEALAARLDARSARVRESGDQFARAVATVRWQSVGADRYRDHCREVRAEVLRNAEELAQAADLLRAHADAVRARIAWMHDMVDSLRREAEEAWDAAEGAFEWGQDQIDRAWHKVTGWL